MRWSLLPFALSISGALGLSIQSRANPFTQANKIFRIFPLGASITAGYDGSKNWNGYRPQLKTLLQAQGQTCNFVGSQSSGDQLDKQHEGHSGWIIKDVQSAALAQLPLYKPNVVTILVGTNDAKTNDTYAAGMLARLDGMISAVYSKVPTALILVSKLPPNSDAAAQRRITTYNNLIPGLVSDWASGRKGAVKNIDYIDPTTWMKVSDLVDGTHPNSAAYTRLGTDWYNVLVKRQSWITPVADIPSQYKGVW